MRPASVQELMVVFLQKEKKKEWVSHPVSMSSFLVSERSRKCFFRLSGFFPGEKPTFFLCNSSPIQNQMQFSDVVSQLVKFTFNILLCIFQFDFAQDSSVARQNRGYINELILRCDQDEPFSVGGTAHGHVHYDTNE